MTATNHALTGAIIGLSISNPIIALPLAFVSHFALDALPHYDPPGDFKQIASSSKFARNLVIDGSLCVVLVAILFVSHPLNWLLASVCAFLAASPDLEWTGNFLRARAGKKLKKHKDFLGKFHIKVQWFHRPIGSVVELTWFVSAIIAVAAIIKA